MTKTVKVQQYHEDAVAETAHDGWINLHDDGRVEIVLSEHEKKALGKRWSTRTVCLVLKPETAEQLRAAMLDAKVAQ